MTPLLSPNEEAIRAWDGPLFDIWVRFREMLVTGVARHGEVALERDPPLAGERVLDVGCGLGDTTRTIAGLVGPDGEAIGLDAAPRMIKAAEADAAGVPNARFIVADPQATAELGGPYDRVFSRFGVMFFANPVVALRNVAANMREDGRLTMVVWRRKLDNEWTHRGERIVKAYLERPDDSEEPTCGPGPFSMANADTVCEVLTYAGFHDIDLFRCDIQMSLGDLDTAITMVMSIGPGGEVLRLLGERADHARPRIEADLREAMAEWVQPDGSISAPSSTWIVSAVR